MALPAAMRAVVGHEKKDTVKKLLKIIERNWTLKNTLKTTIAYGLSYTLYTIILNKDFEISQIVIIGIVSLFFIWGYKREIQDSNESKREKDKKG
jgi:hypothetical protein